MIRSLASLPALLGAAFLVLMLAASNASAQCELAKVVRGDGDQVVNVGQAVAIDGDRAVIGAEAVDPAGKAFVYRFDGSSWIEEAVLTAVDGNAPSSLGSTMAIDGDVIVLGCLDDDNYRGSAHVYRHVGTQWLAEAKLTVSGGAPHDYFGYSVAVHGDVLVVGAPGLIENDGAAYVYRYDGGAWHLEAKVQSSDGVPGDAMGAAVAVNADVLMVTDPQRDSGTGAVHVFGFDGSTWVEKATLRSSDGTPEGYFGHALALVDGVAVITALGTGTNWGAGYVFAFDGTTWRETFKLVADVPSDSGFGRVVSLTPEGDRVAIGAPLHGSGRGAVYLYRFRGSAWEQAALLRASDREPDDYFGWSAALAPSNGHVLVGAYCDKHDGGSHAARARLTSFDGDLPRRAPTGRDGRAPMVSRHSPRAATRCSDRRSNCCSTTRPGRPRADC